MATITIAIASQTKSFTVSGGNITRIVNALKPHYGQVFDPALGGGDPPVGAMRDRTNDEVFDLLASGFMQSLKDIVQSQEGEAAAKTARAGIAAVAST